MIGDHGGRDLVHFKTAVGFGDLDATQPKFPGFLQKVARNGEIFVLNFFNVRHNLVQGKFFRGLPDKLVLFAEIFGREYIFGLSGFQQEAAARNPGLGNCRGCHVSPSIKETAEP